ncbi:hypothetical protein BN2497_3141 [Janthinobacterium sp. CG23_2]|nr:hypothetical protein BN2497_3141 [Janthinobacterium sp. CG23_2]CUU27968.1 hypothetical protein BN3177_3141 [Janthinobacterium sp. CG23_2]
MHDGLRRYCDSIVHRDEAKELNRRHAELLCKQFSSCIFVPVETVRRLD